MSCTRCQGPITVESYVDAEEDGYGLRWISAWHCVSCGRVPEPITLARPRTSRRRAVSAGTRPTQAGQVTDLSLLAKIPA